MSGQDHKFFISLGAAGRLPFTVTRDLFCPTYRDETLYTAKTCPDPFTARNLIERAQQRKILDLSRDPESGVPDGLTGKTRRFEALHRRLSALFAPIALEDSLIDSEEEIQKGLEAQVLLDLAHVAPFLRKSSQPETWGSADQTVAHALYRLLSGFNKKKAEADLKMETPLLPASIRGEIKVALQALSLDPLMPPPEGGAHRKKASAVEPFPHWMGFKLPKKGYSVPYSQFLPHFLIELIKLPESVLPPETVDQVVVEFLSRYPKLVQASFVKELYARLGSRSPVLKDYLQGEGASSLLDRLLTESDPKDDPVHARQFELLTEAAKHGAPAALRHLVQVLVNPGHALLVRGKERKSYYWFPSEFIDFVKEAASETVQLEEMPVKFRQELRLMLPRIFRGSDSHAATLLIAFAQRDEQAQVWQDLEESYAGRFRDFWPKEQKVCRADLPKDGNQCHAIHFPMLAQGRVEELEEPDFSNIPQAILHDASRIGVSGEQAVDSLKQFADSAQREAALGQLRRFVESNTRHTLLALKALADLAHPGLAEIMSRDAYDYSSVAIIRNQKPIEAEPEYIQGRAMDYFDRGLKVPELLAWNSSDLPEAVRTIAALLESGSYSREYANAFEFVSLLSKREGAGAQGAVMILEELADIHRYGLDPYRLLYEVVHGGFPESGLAWLAFERLSGSAWINDEEECKFARESIAIWMQSIAEAPLAGRHSFQAGEALVNFFDDETDLTESLNLKARITSVDLEVLKGLVRDPHAGEGTLVPDPESETDEEPVDANTSVPNAADLFIKGIPDFTENDELYDLWRKMAVIGNRNAFNALVSSLQRPGDISVMRQFDQMIQDTEASRYHADLIRLAEKLSRSDFPASAAGFALLVRAADWEREGSLKSLLSVALSDTFFWREAAYRLLPGSKEAQSDKMKQECHRSLIAFDGEMARRVRKRAPDDLELYRDFAKKLASKGYYELSEALNLLVPMEREPEQIPPSADAGLKEEAGVPAETQETTGVLEVPLPFPYFDLPYIIDNPLSPVNLKSLVLDPNTSELERDQAIFSLWHLSQHSADPGIQLEAEDVLRNLIVKDCKTLWGDGKRESNGNLVDSILDGILRIFNDRKDFAEGPEGLEQRKAVCQTRTDSLCFMAQAAWELYLGPLQVPKQEEEE